MRIEEQRRGVVRGYNDGYFQFHASNSQELFPQCYRSLRTLPHTKSADKWAESQKQRAGILFEQYPDIREAYLLAHSLRMIFLRNTIKDAARLSLARWYNKVDNSGFKRFNVIAATLYEHYDGVFNIFVERATNAFAESFNAKIKVFRATLRGVADIKFLMFRLSKIYA